MTDRFDPDILERFQTEEEVRIGTSRGPDAPEHRTIIWIVVSDGDVFVRSVRGPRGRWFRDLQADPSATLVARRAPKWPPARRKKSRSRGIGTMPSRLIWRRSKPPGSDETSAPGCTRARASNMGEKRHPSEPNSACAVRNAST